MLSTLTSRRPHPPPQFALWELLLASGRLLPICGSLDGVGQLGCGGLPGAAGVSASLSAREREEENTSMWDK